MRRRVACGLLAAFHRHNPGGGADGWLGGCPRHSKQTRMGRLMRTIQAFRFALDPNNAQRSALAAHCGASRFAFNWGLSLVKERLEQRESDPSVQVPWNLPALRREWNRAKQDVAPWWSANSKEAYSSGLDALARALNNFSGSRKGKRKGRPTGFPRFRKRGHSRRSCRFTTGGIAVVGDRHIRLPRIGVLRTAEPTAKLGAGEARILSATICEQAGRWFVSFTCEVERKHTRKHEGDVAGVNAGVRHLAVVAGTHSPPLFVANPRPLQAHRRKLARLQRQQSRRRPGSKRRAATRARLGRCHRRIADIRRDSMHKLTTGLAKRYATIAVEDLAVANMTKRRRGRGRAAKAGLNRAILDSSLAELRRQLTYKCAWYDSALVTVNRNYPSSKTCSDCGRRKPSLAIQVRVFECDGCGLVLDRDHNAARNLAKAAVAASAAETQNGRGEKVRPGAIQAHLDEPSTGQLVYADVSPGALEP